MNDSSPHRYLLEGRLLGLPEDILQHVLARTDEIESTGAGTILSLGHLAHLSGASYFYLRKVVQRTIDPYVDITRPKRTGGIRLISAPEPILMDVQRVILHRALASLRLDSSSYAYQRGRSIVDCAKRHIGAHWLIKLDLHDFFGQIDERRAFRVFTSLGYSRLLALELARLCTRPRGMTRWRPSRGRYSVIPGYDVAPFGYLPQGAPTSGAIANAVATPMDELLRQLATSRGLAYTRYSDDLTFSTSSDFDRDEATEIIRAATSVIRAQGFILHYKKTRIVTPGARHVVLGLLVQQDRVSLTPEFRRRVLTHIRGVAKFGLADHCSHRDFRSVLSFIAHVDGCLAFASDVDPGWAESSRLAWHQALHASRFPREAPMRSGPP